MSKLLMDCRPLTVLPTLAELVGINEAIAAQQIHWVIYTKEEHKDNRTLHDGFLWCEYTLKEWQKKLPWLSCSGIRKILKNLENYGIVISCQPKAKLRDQTKWYRVDANRIKALEDGGLKTLLDLSESNNSEVSESNNSEVSESNNSEVSESNNSSVLKRYLKIKEKKEADFSSFEIRDIKDEALDEENINLTANAKIQDPIPPTPLSHPPEISVKPLPPDPMGDRFRYKTKHRWQKVMSDSPEWQEVLTEWAGSKDCRLGFKESLLKAQIAHLKKWKLPDEIGDAMSSLSNYIKNKDIESFEARVDTAIAIEEADRRLKTQNITKPECTVTQWYLWKPMGTAAENGGTITWDHVPQPDRATKQEQSDRQAIVIQEFLGKLQSRDLIYLAIANKHSLKKGSTASKSFFQDEVIQDYAIYLQYLAQQQQGAIAA